MAHDHFYGICENKCLVEIEHDNIPGVVPVEKGGTGATTAANARSKLGAAAASHTHTFASLTSKPTTISGYGIKDFAGKSVAGQTVSPTEDTTVTAGEGAEIFNDYYTRTSTSAYGNIASGKFSHAEGARTTASGDYAHSEGRKTTASNSYAHAEGSETTASGSSSHAEGVRTTASGMNSHAEGFESTASGYTSHAEGYKTTASGDRSHAEGHSTTASGDYSHAEGSGTLAEKNYAHAEGLNTKAQGQGSHAEGFNTTTTLQYSHAEGHGTTASGGSAHAEGSSTTASGSNSHAEGGGTTASGMNSHAEGSNTTASGHYSHAGGYHTIANKYQMVHGRYNISSDGATSDSNMTGDIFIIGNGTAEDSRSNAFRVTTAGAVYGKAAYNSSGADYAEMWEIEGGNPNGDDWRGLFVTVNEKNKIEIANPDDYILGIISATPSVLGDVQSEIWHKMYLKDVFGEHLTETVEVEETTDEFGDVTPAHTETRWILNPEYDSSKEYISRDKRPEWAAVGLIGKLVVVDDGTCTPGQFCKVADGGIATASGNNEGYRVLERCDKNHVRIMFR